MKARLTKKEKHQLNLGEKLIFFYRKYPIRAAKDLMKVDLVWFQRKTLRSLWNKKYNLLLMSRGIGKTWLLALFCVLYAMLNPGVHIGIITPSFKQTDFLFDKISDFYEESAFLRAASVKRPQRTTFKAIVRFRNGAWIEGLPLGTGEKIRGRRYNVIVVDEYAFVDENIIKMVVRPMMNVKKKGIDNKYIVSSTAYYTWNHFYLQYLLYVVMSAKKSNMYGLHEYTYEDLKMVSDPPFELDDDVYEMMRMDTSEEIYLMENKCKFPINEIGFFTPRLIDNCTPRDQIDPVTNLYTQRAIPIELEADPVADFYTMGVDAARIAGGDNFAISIIRVKDEIKSLVHVFTMNGKTYQEMVEAIRRLLDVFPVVQMNVDAAGGGMTLKDLLAQPYKRLSGEILPAILDMDDKEMEMREGIKILRMVNFTRPVVNDLYMRLKADMQHRIMQFPMDIRRFIDKEMEKVAYEILETKRELLVLQAEGKGNYYVFDVPSQFKKDRATALALSNQASNEVLDGAFSRAESQLAEGMWV